MEQKIIEDELIRYVLIKMTEKEDLVNTKIGLMEAGLDIAMNFILYRIDCNELEFGKAIELLGQTRRYIERATQDTPGEAYGYIDDLVEFSIDDIGLLYSKGYGTASEAERATMRNDYMELKKKDAESIVSLKDSMFRSAKSGGTLHEKLK